MVIAELNGNNRVLRVEWKQNILYQIVIDTDFISFVTYFVHFLTK